MSWSSFHGRDPRLDFFRGLAMFIIFFAHTPGNIVKQFIPARFGPSDATEMFILCSGLAAALAFGATFRYSGFLIGVMRTLKRVWELYWAHIGLFLVIALICLAATEIFPQDYIGKLNLYYFFNQPQEALLGLFTLSYVPNLFDILPIYIVALALLPLIILLRAIHITAAILFSLGLYLATWFVFDLELSAGPSGNPWFFNPFSWQLLFFTAFAFGAKWFAPPKPNLLLFLFALIYVIVWIPISYSGFHAAYPILAELRTFLLYGEYDPNSVLGIQLLSFWTNVTEQFPGLLTIPPIDVYGTPKTNLHIFRYFHILALAYLMICIFWNRERLLLAISPIIKVGQQALPTFLTSIVLSWCGGIYLDQVGKTPESFIVVNVVGIGGLILAAYSVAWYKSAPWSSKKADSDSSPINSPPILVFSGNKNS